MTSSISRSRIFWSAFLDGLGGSLLPLRRPGSEIPLFADEVYETIPELAPAVDSVAVEEIAPPAASEQHPEWKLEPAIDIPDVLQPSHKISSFPPREKVRIRVIGVGGGGANAVNNMIHAGMEGLEFLVASTDAQCLSQSLAPTRLLLGAGVSSGLGAGANPDLGRRAALEDSEKIIEALEGADMVILAAGFGGGTGTGAAPVIASLAHEMGILTIAIVTQPFSFEGKRRASQATRGIEEMLESVHAMIVIPNDKLLAEGKNTGFFESFRMADDAMQGGVRSIADMVKLPGILNRNIAEVWGAMAGMGYAAIGAAVRAGANRAVEAAQAAMKSPLIEEGALARARMILVNITGSSALMLSEVSDASSVIQSAVPEDANVVIGTVLDQSMNESVKITIIAAGNREQAQHPGPRVASFGEIPPAAIFDEDEPAHEPAPPQKQQTDAQTDAADKEQDETKGIRNR